VIAVALLSVYFATLVPGPEWTHSFGLGGLFGDTVLGALIGVVPGSAGFGLKFASLLVGAGVVVMTMFVTGFDLFELRLIFRFLLVGSVMGYNAALSAAGRGAQGTARAAVQWKDRRAEAASAYPPSAVRHGDWQPETAANPARQGMVRRPNGAEPPLTEPAPVPQGWGRAAPLRANPRYPEPLAEAPHYAPTKERTGLLARMPALVRRVVDPEPELIEQEPPLHDDDYIDEDRIKARISDVIRSRSRMPQGPTTAVTAAVMRREPTLSRPNKPVTLLADTTRRPAGMLPSEPPLTAAAAAVAMQAAQMAAPSRIVPPLSAAPVGGIFPRGMTPPASDAYEDSSAGDWDGDESNLFDTDDSAEAGQYGASPHDAGPYGAGDHGAVAYDAGYDASSADDWVPDADMEPDYDPTPVSVAPRLGPAVGPLVAPSIDRRGVVQHTMKKQVAPSRQAMAESQPRLKFEEPKQDYELPPLSLLSSPSTIVRHSLSDEALEENARMLESVLDDYGVKGEIVSVRPGPVVTMYELEPAPGLKASRVIGLADDIARSMSALSARVSTVPGRTVIGIELPNAQREKVVLREILSARDFGDSQMRLPLALGKDIGGEPVVANLAKMPHLLIAGTTGSGKSVAINTMILSLLYKLTPEECRLIMIDPKMLELSVYDGIPHLLSPVVTDPKKAVVALKWVVGEMEERYRKMSKMGVRNIEGYNGRVREALSKSEMFKRTIQTGFDEETGDPVFETEEFAPVALPYIVVIVDEMADLMMVAGKEIEACIQRLAQMARASGIHLIMATQRPSVDVITGTIKANFPTRISFQVTSKIDSRTILGEQGAEQLLGMGDMLYMAGGARITRIHGPFVSDEEVEEVVTHLKSFGPPKYMSGVVEGVDDDRADDIDAVLGLNIGGNTEGEDALYDQAVAIVAKDRKCSTSYIQRKLGIGYNKAARLVEQMEEQGVVTQANHVGKREILIPEA
jgi:DNA segregation ATPase FtsK/SpoIIIE, S-DNA-T family